MDFGDIKASLARLQSLVEGWESAGVTELERDIALEELRRIYSEIRFGGTAAVSGKVDESAATVIPPVVTEESVQEESAAIEGESEEPEIEVELIMSDDEDEPADEALPQEQTAEPTFEPAAEPETASETEEETVPETEAEQTIDEAEVCVDETVVETVATTYDTAENHVENHAESHTESRKSEQSLFGDDEVVLPRSSRRRVLMSLYDDEMPTVIAERADERKPEPKINPEPKTNPAPEMASELVSETVAAVAEKHAEEFAETDAPEDSEPRNTETKYGDALGDEMPEPVVMPAIDDEIVLGDVLRADVHTLGESIARAKDISEAAPVASLRAAIGINDRFLLIRDLFGGDAAAYEKAIVAIDSFDNLDDCMVHIVENYSWRSTSDGAKLIMNLIQRKFRK